MRSYSLQSHKRRLLQVWLIQSKNELMNSSYAHCALLQCLRQNQLILKAEGHSAAEAHLGKKEVQSMLDPINAWQRIVFFITAAAIGPLHEHVTLCT